MYLYVCLCACVFVGRCICAYVCVYVCRCVCLCACVCADVHVYVCVGAYECGDQRKTLGVIPQKPSTLMFGTESFTDLEFAN